MTPETLRALLLSDCLNVACDAFDARFQCGDCEQQQQLFRRDRLAMEYASAIYEEMWQRPLTTHN